MTKTMRTATLAGLLATAGCYTWAEVEPGAVRAGSEVRVEIERAEAVRQVELLGGLDTGIAGTVAELDTDGIGLTFRDPAAGAGDRGFRSYVEFDWDRVLAVEEKRFSLVRTGLLAGAVAVVTVAILEIADNSAGADGEPGPINENRIRIPILSIGR